MLICPVCFLNGWLCEATKTLPINNNIRHRPRSHVCINQSSVNVYHCTLFSSGSMQSKCSNVDQICLRCIIFNMYLVLHGVLLFQMARLLSYTTTLLLRYSYADSAIHDGFLEVIFVDHCLLKWHFSIWQQKDACCLC